MVHLERKSDFGSNLLAFDSWIVSHSLRRKCKCSVKRVGPHYPETARRELKDHYHLPFIIRMVDATVPRINIAGSTTLKHLFLLFVIFDYRYHFDYST